MSGNATLLLAGLAGLSVLAAVLYFVLHWRFERWKRDYSKELRRDAVQRSQAVTLGKVCEHLIPYLPDFRWNPKDARFLGSPVDLVVFDGLDAGQLQRIVFLEVKTGGAGLSARERQLRDVVRAGKVSWQEMRTQAKRIE